MKTLYPHNGLIFWTQEEIRLRRAFEDHFASGISATLKTLNAAFEFIQVEAPQITPRELIDASYSDEDIFALGEKLALRPETTMGSYAYARELLNPHQERKIRLPLCVWQHGKSFRQEQDKTLANMRLKEFYQLEFQIIFSKTTANDYYPALVAAVHALIAKFVGACHTEPSDRLPKYAEETTDVVMDWNQQEVCSMSRRTDFDDYKVIEIAIGTDRCVYNLQNKPL